MNRLLPLITIMFATINTFAAETIPKVSLVTVGAGKEMYQLEGHTILRLTYPDGRDIAVNWGVFDFSSPNFAYRFLKGETDYSIGIFPFSHTLAGYRREQRPVTEQALNLSEAQTETLIGLIEENLRPENRIYRYNYVKDNCATRPMALIEQALAADSASLRINMPQTRTTFREEMRRYHRNFPAYQLFIDIALGSGIDYRLTNREQAFAPIYLEELVANSTIISPGGIQRPLSASARILVNGPAEPYTENCPNPWIFAFVLLVATAAVTWRDQRIKKVSKWFDTVFYFIYGLIGLLLAFLIFISVHEATSPNVNFLWLNPLCLAVPLLIWFKRCRKVVFWYQFANFVALIVFIIGTPFFTQSGNWLFLPLILSDLARSTNYLIINRR